LVYLCHVLVQGHQIPPMFSGVFRAEKFDGVGDKGSGDNDGWGTNTVGGIFEMVPEIFLFQ